MRCSGKAVERSMSRHTASSQLLSLYHLSAVGEWEPPSVTDESRKLTLNMWFRNLAQRLIDH